MLETRKNFMGKLMILLATLIWGTTFLILKNAIENLPICLVLSIRFLLSFFLLTICFPRKMKMARTTLRKGAWLGVILAAAYAVQTFGLKYTTPAKNSFLTAVYAVMVPFFLWIRTQKKPTRYHLIAAVVSFCGILTVCFGNSGQLEVGDGLTVCSGVFFALQIIFLSEYTEKEDVLQLVIIELGTAGVIFAFGFFCFELPGSAITLGANEWFPILYLAVFATCGTQLLQAQGQKYVSGGTASLILSLESVFATIFSVIFYEGEQLTLNLYVGFALIFAALLISESKPLFTRLKMRFGKK